MGLRKIHYILILILLLTISCAHTKQSKSYSYEKLKVLTAEIQSKLNEVNDKLIEASQKISKVGLKGKATEKVLSDLCNEMPSVIDCATIDLKGNMIEVMPGRYNVYEGKNIADQEQFKMLKITKRPVISKIFKSVEGMYVIDFQYPIFQKGKLIGTVSLIVKPSPFMSKIVNPKLSWDALGVIVMQPNGQIFYCKYKKAIGTNPLHNPPYKISHTQRKAIEKVLKHEAGTIKYKHKPVGKADAERRQAYWKTVEMYNAKFRVVLYGQLSEVNIDLDDK